MTDEPEKLRFICTAERPWIDAYGVPAAHLDARQVGEQDPGWPGGDIVRYECPHCHVTWTQELPQ